MFGRRSLAVGSPSSPKVVIDRNRYTGQNPGSSAALAKRIIAGVSGQVDIGEEG